MTRVQHFYDQDTSTFTFVVSDPNSGLAATVSPLLNLDYALGTLGTRPVGAAVLRTKVSACNTSSKPTSTPTTFPVPRIFQSSSAENL